MPPIVIVDDNEDARDGLNLFIRKQGAVVQNSFRDAETAWEFLHKTPHVIALIDIRMPRSPHVTTVDIDAGIWLTKRLKSMHPQMKIVLMSNLREYRQVVQPLLDQYRGTLAFEDPSQGYRHLWHAVQNLTTDSADGSALAQTYIEVEKMLRNWLTPEEQPLVNTMLEHFHELDARQLLIVNMLAESCTNEQVAQALELSRGTTDNYITDVFRLLGMPDRRGRANRNVILVKAYQLYRLP